MFGLSTFFSACVRVACRSNVSISKKKSPIEKNKNKKMKLHQLVRAVGGKKSQTKWAVNQYVQQKAGSRWSIRVEGWMKLTVCAQLVGKAAIFAFWQISALQEYHWSKPEAPARQNTDQTFCDNTFLHTCTAVVTSNWSVCSCLCFSSWPLVSLSLASSSLDLISSDSCAGGKSFKK